MLTPDQLTAIDRHLRKENWLLNEDLIAELTDHYAAGLDERLAHGQDFDTAIREIHAGFGGRRGLLKMEEDKVSSRSLAINLELRNLIVSYSQPPRLSLTILLLGFAYWLVTTHLINEWFRTVYACFILIVPALLLMLFFRNGYLYIAGRKQSMQLVKVTFYRYFLALNLLNVLHFFWGDIHTISTYSTAWQTLIVFAYLLIGTITLDFTFVQRYRNKVLTQY